MGLPASKCPSKNRRFFFFFFFFFFFLRSEPACYIAAAVLPNIQLGIKPACPAVRSHSAGIFTEPPKYPSEANERFIGFRAQRHLP